MNGAALNKRAVARGPIQHFLVWMLVTAAAVLWPASSEPGSLGLALGLALLCAGCASLSASVSGAARATITALYIAIAVPSFVLMVGLGHYLNFRGQPGRDALRAVAQTNFAEALDYVATLMSTSTTAMTGAALLLLGATFPSRSKAAPGNLRAVLLGLMAVALAGALLRPAIPDFFGPMYAHIARYQQETEAFRQLLHTRQGQQIKGAATNMRGTIVVVIGESTTRRHMHLYGYPRSTTPRLDAFGASMLRFDDVISTHSHTVPALMSALTSSGSSEQEKFFDESSIDFVSLARSAGIRTHWLSNQNEFGIWDNAVSIVAKSADEATFFSNSIGRTLRRSAGDHEMVPVVQDILKTKAGAPRIVFVHLFAAHSPYCANHPGAADGDWPPYGPGFYGERKELSNVNCYDSSIRYIDGVVADLAQATLAADEPAALLFFSDHGEAPLLGTGHESSMHSSYHLEIPFLLFANDAFRSDRPDLWQAAGANRGRPYSTSRLYHTLADLASISHPSVATGNSILSAGYSDQNRTALNGRIQYDRWSAANDYRTNARIGLAATGPLWPRVWAHRVDTLGTMLEAKSIFSGVESDLVFDDDCSCFHVYHPPAADVGLELGQLLEAAADRPNLRLWLDWKNASADNIDAAIRELARLDGRFGIKGRALVETGSDATFPGVARLGEAGYRTAYYLPTEAIRNVLRKGDEGAQRVLAEKIIRTVTDGGFDAITFDWRLAPFVNKWLDPFVQQRGLGTYSWDMSIDPARQSTAPALIEARFRARNLDGLLITFPSVFRR